MNQGQDELQQILEEEVHLSQSQTTNCESVINCNEAASINPLDLPLLSQQTQSSESNSNSSPENKKTEIIKIDESIVETKSIHEEDSKHSDSESDTRGRQYLLLALERLRYIALDRKRWDNYKITPPVRPLGLYILFNQPVPLLWNKKDWPKVPNWVHFELPVLIREVKFTRKFINQNQNPSKLVCHGLHDSFNCRNSNNNATLEFFGTHQTASIRYQDTQSVAEGFRNLSCCTIGGRFPSPAIKPCFLGFANNKDLCNLIPWKEIKSNKRKRRRIFTLERDRKFLESVNIWHLVNLSSDEESIFCHDKIVKPRMRPVIAPDVVTSHQSLLDENENSSELLDPEVEESEIPEDKASEELPNLSSNSDNNIMMRDQLCCSLEEKSSIEDFKIYVGQSSEAFNTVQLSPEPIRYEPDEDYCFDFDHGQTVIRKLSKKTVTFSPDTVFVQRDMDSPFWKDFSERRRQRRIMREQRLNGNFTNRMSLFDILRVTFKSRNKTDSRVRHADTYSNTEDPEGLVDLIRTSNLSQSTEHSSQAVRPIPSSKFTKVIKFLFCGCCTQKNASE